MNHSAIETNALRKEFGAKVAVADLTLTVQRGEVFGFLGPNGAGKTTSVKMLLGLVARTSGEGRVLDAPLGNVAARAKIGFLPEHFRFQDWLSGREFLDLHARLYGIETENRKARIEKLLTRVDLQDAANRKLKEYSKGMLQRIGLAAALLNEPQLVFLDEPTSGLDPLGRLIVRDVIQELRAQGTAVFLNSHLLSEVEVTCDRVAFVKNGRVIREMGLRETRNEIEIELQVKNPTPNLLRDLAQFGKNVRQWNGSIHLETDGESHIPEINRWLVAQGVDVYKIGAAKPSLEKMFLEVMGEDARAG
ncbi:MAG: ABC transporter [Chloroflexi bacterium UTCFX4]|jgi:ABC-2 type transport system ATP-binding protein|nr:MAG: ABC transporter [Chloroflexi bacterium UTCFX4]